MAAYEVHGIREDGSIFGEVGFERNRRRDAWAIARYYFNLWTQAAEVRLYRTPEANLSSVSSFNLWPGRVQLVGRFRR